MQTIFSTDGVLPKNRFRHWKDICEDRIVPLNQSCLDNEPFNASIKGANIGGLDFTWFALSNLRVSTTPRTLRSENHKTDQLFLNIVLNGTVCSHQNDRSSTDEAGDFAIRDTNTSWANEHNGYSEVVAISIPRKRLEGVLGSARIFAGLTVDSHQPVATLTRSFLCNLMREGGRLPPSAAERMAGVGIDLVIASLAERLAKEVPRPISGVLVIQRAKAYVEANLNNVSLDPPLLAAAVGVSLRRLQQLFHDHGQHISDWIWQRRLLAASRHLKNPGCRHISIGILAYECGFASQPHFSRRFKAHFGMTPSEYRHASRMRDL